MHMCICVSWASWSEAADARGLARPALRGQADAGGGVRALGVNNKQTNICIVYTILFYIL